jgi:hypothetical protein
MVDIKYRDVASCIISDKNKSLDNVNYSININGTNFTIYQILKYSIKNNTSDKNLFSSIDDLCEKIAIINEIKNVKDSVSISNIQTLLQELVNSIPKLFNDYKKIINTNLHINTLIYTYLKLKCNPIKIEEKTIYPIFNDIHLSIPDGIFVEIAELYNNAMINEEGKQKEHKFKTCLKKIPTLQQEGKDTEGKYSFHSALPIINCFINETIIVFKLLINKKLNKIDSKKDTGILSHLLELFRNNDNKYNNDMDKLFMNDDNQVSITESSYGGGRRLRSKSKKRKRNKSRSKNKKK